ncbi:cyclic pyranopterin monophosphate synthase MoaC [bacterium]|nr:MAG: cyclic pyranopterin monophosphate synthase MoaC [bacterium]
MIDISAKKITAREAVAEGRVFLKPQVIKLIREKKIPKGDVLEASRLAGILAAKKTPEIIPLCHPIPIESVKVDFVVNDRQINITSAVKGQAKTGFEMEALTAVSAAALTIYDMCKPLDKDIVISEIKLLKKSGGKSGTYVRR